MLSKDTRGFTLIELLVVIAIIALLLSIVVPSLRLAKQKASTSVCLTNTKNLALGWYMYQQDGGGRIMSALMDGTEEPSGVRVGWINRPYKNTPGDCSITQTHPEVTDEDEIRGIRDGRLYEYVNEPKAYHCPGDRLRTSKYDGSTIYVSYSIPAALYGHTNPSHVLYNRQIRRYSEIRLPSSRYVFVETAEERNWNENGRFVMGVPQLTGGPWGWWGPMAINHGDSSVLAYADGHSEVRRWRDSFTKERISKLSRLNVPTYDIEFPPPEQIEDIAFMARGWPYRGN